jgi:hypothetical protein
MKTTVRNIIAGLFFGTAIFTIQAEEITTGAILNANNQEIISYTVHHLSCAGANDGSIDIEIVNGGTYFFSWDNGMNIEDLTNLPVGTYRVKIESNAGEVVFASFEVTSPQVLQGVINQTDLHTTVNLDLVVEGGVTPYIYSWSNGVSDEDIFGVTTEGIYEVNVTDANGCQLNIGTYVAMEAAGIVEETSTFELYPNPNNGNGTITWNNADVKQINILNGAGQVVRTQEVENTTNASFEGLTPGIYVATVQTVDNTQSIKFIVL